MEDVIIGVETQDVESLKDSDLIAVAVDIDNGEYTWGDIEFSRLKKQIIGNNDIDNISSTLSDHVENTNNPHNTKLFVNELKDVVIESLSDKDILMYNIDKGQFENIQYKESGLSAIKWDDENNRWVLNDRLHIEGGLTAEQEIAAYADTATDSIWDDMPVATADSLGGVRVDDSVSEVYLDENNILRVDGDLTALEDHSVTELNDVEDAGSGKIITSSERSNLSSAYDHISNTSNPHQTGFSNAEDYDITDAFFAVNEGNNEQDAGMKVHIGNSNYQLFKWDKENQRWLLDADVHIEGAVTATEEIAAYADTATDSIWDDMPVATADSLGGVKVDDSVSEVYLDSNNILQIDIPDDVGQWDNVTGGIEYTGGDVDITNGNLHVSGNTTIEGDLTVQGTEFIANTETVEIEDNLAIINSGETGDGVTAGFAGWEVDRGTYTNYRWGFDESTDTFRLGEKGDLQAVATRPDSITDDTMALWDDANNRLKFVERSNIDVGDFNNDIGYLSSIPTLQNITEQGNTTTKNITVNGLTANSTVTSDGLTSTGLLEIDNRTYEKHLKIKRDARYVNHTIGVDDSYRILLGDDVSAMSVNGKMEVNGNGVPDKEFKVNGDSEFTGSLELGKKLIGDTFTIDLDAGSDEKRITSNKVGGAATMEFQTYNGKLDRLSTRLLLRGSNNSDIEFYDENEDEIVIIDGETGDTEFKSNITADGEIEAYSSSDKFLKYNIQDFTASELLEKLHPVTFNWNDIAKELNSKKTDGLHYGLIAQEVEEVMPEIVKNMYGGKYLGLDYEQLIPVLVQALKEQQKEIENLKNK